MMRIKKITSITRTFIEESLSQKAWYKKVHNHIFGISITGSQAHNLARKDSDIDIHIFLPTTIEKQYTNGEYRYKFKKKEFNIIIRSVERLRKLAHSQNNTLEGWVIEKDIILYEKKKNCLKKLMKEISRWPEKRWKELIAKLIKKRAVLTNRLKKTSQEVVKEKIRGEIISLGHRILFAEKRRHFPVKKWVDEGLYDLLKTKV